MSVLYVKEQGAFIQRRSERLLVTKGRQTLLEIHLDNIESIAVIGNVQITAQALCVLMERGIDVSHFSFSGRYLGATAADSSKNIFLRLAQYDLYQDLDSRMRIARRIVANKIKNQREMIRSHRWEFGDRDVREVLQDMDLLQTRTEGCLTSNELMGIEGRASSIYFQLYGRMFTCRIEFHGRNRRPPKDPINVIISLGYTFLTKEVSSALEAESFEMYLGLLYGVRYGRKSLPLDIVEEFRQPVIDRMALKLFNKGMLQEYDFTQEEGMITLSEDGFRKF